MLHQHPMQFWHIHRFTHFIHHGVPARKTKSVQKWLQLLGNSSDLNPMENAWNHMKNKVQDVQLSNIGELQAALKDSCVHMQMAILSNWQIRCPQDCTMY